MVFSLLKVVELMDTLIDPSITSIWAYIAYLSGIPFWIAKVETAARYDDKLWPSKVRLTAGSVTEPWIKLQSSKDAVVWYVTGININCKGSKDTF
jgi:hypothetical protein